MRIRHSGIALALLLSFATSTLALQQTFAQQLPRRAQNPPQTQNEIAAARALAEEGKLPEAETAARAYLAAHKDSADTHFLLGLILFREAQAGVSPSQAGPATEYNVLSASLSERMKNQAKASLAEFTEGAKFQIPSAFDLKIVALDYILLADYTDADKWLTRSLQGNPADAQAWYYLGRTKYNENRFEEAVDAFQRCLKLSTKDVKAEDNLGLSYAGLGRTEEAIEAYRTAISWQADGPAKDPGPYLDWGSLLLDSNQPQSAIPLLIRAMELAPQQGKSHELLGKAYSQIGDLPKAQAQLEIAVSLNPGSAPLHFILGQIYRKEGLLDKAKAELETSATLNATHSTGHTTGP